MSFDHFDLLAPFYDRVIRFDRLEQMLRVLALPAPVCLLDAGGGTGRVAEALRPHVSGLILADASTGMLAQAAAKQLTCACSETEHLPFPDGSFERVLMVDALHHVRRQRRTVLELWRVLRPGGRLVIEEPDVRTLAVKFIALAEKLAFMRSHFLTPGQIAALLAGTPARISIEARDANAWVIIDKPG